MHLLILIILIIINAELFKKVINTIIAKTVMDSYRPSHSAVGESTWLHVLP